MTEYSPRDKDLTFISWKDILDYKNCNHIIKFRTSIIFMCELYITIENKFKNMDIIDRIYINLLIVIFIENTKDIPLYKFKVPYFKNENRILIKDDYINKVPIVHISVLDLYKFIDKNLITKEKRKEHHSLLIHYMNLMDNSKELIANFNSSNNSILIRDVIASITGPS